MCWLFKIDDQGLFSTWCFNGHWLYLVSFFFLHTISAGSKHEAALLQRWERTDGRTAFSTEAQSANLGGTTTLNAAVVAVGKTEILKQSKLGPATNSSKYLDTEGKIIEDIHIFYIHQVLNIHDMDLENP